MKNIEFKCRKCGHIMIVPDKTGSVLCGNCATWNKPHSLLFSPDKPETGQEEGSILQRVPGSIFSETPDPAHSGEHESRADDGPDVPQKTGLISLIAIVLVLAPVVSFLVEKFSLPPVLTLIVFAVVIALYQFSRKRS